MPGLHILHFGKASYVSSHLWSGLAKILQAKPVRLNVFGDVVGSGYIIARTIKDFIKYIRVMADSKHAAAGPKFDANEASCGVGL